MLGGGGTQIVAAASGVDNDVEVIEAMSKLVSLKEPGTITNTP